MSTSGSTSPSPTGDGAAGGPSPMTVGKRFVKQYYQVLSTTPDQIFRFYQPKLSMLSHGTGSDPTSPSLFESYDMTARWGAGDRKKRFELEHGAIDAQPSVNGGILLIVTGHVVLLPGKGSDASKEERKGFVHTFFLGTLGDAKRFYVHNDVLRFLHEGSPVKAKGENGKSDAISTTRDKADSPAQQPATTLAETSDDKKIKKLKEDMSEPAKDVKPEKEKLVPSADDAPGGGVEESKEEVDDDVEPEESGSDKGKSAPTETKAEKSKENKAPESKDGDAAGKDRANKGKKGKGAPSDTSGKVQQPPPQKAAPKPVPGSWASLVATGGGPTASTPVAASSPAKPRAPEKTAPETKPVADTKAAAQTDKGGDNNITSNTGGNKGMGSRDRNKRDPDCTLVIKNLAENTKESDVVALFEPFAAQTKSKIVGTTVANHRGLAFVDYDSDAPVLAALKVHQREPMKLNGRVLEVDQKSLEQRNRRNMRGGYRSGSPGNGGNRHQYRRGNMGRGGGGGDRRGGRGGR